MTNWGIMTDEEAARAAYYHANAQAARAHEAETEAAREASATARARTAAEAVEHWRAAERAAARAERAAAEARAAADAAAELAPEAAQCAQRGEDLKARYADEIGSYVYNAEYFSGEAADARKWARAAAISAGRYAEQKSRQERGRNLALCGC